MRSRRQASRSFRRAGASSNRSRCARTSCCRPARSRRAPHTLDPAASTGRSMPCLHEFPQLAERLDNAGGSLSGGEQQMLAIGRALMANPSVILMDEPSEGLSPKLVQRVEEIMRGSARKRPRHPAGGAEPRARALGRGPHSRHFVGPLRVRRDAGRIEPQRRRARQPSRRGRRAGALIAVRLPAPLVGATRRGACQGCKRSAGPVRAQRREPWSSNQLP